MYGCGEESRYRFGVECRRWLGLRVCTAGPDHWIFKSWADLGARCAVEKWNDMVRDAWTPKQRGVPQQ